MNRTPRRALTRLVAASATAVVLAASVAAGPARAGDPVQVSLDGATGWSDDLTSALFDSTWRWTPGDASGAVTSLYVRNDSGADARATVDLQVLDVPAGLFVPEVQVDGGPWLATPAVDAVPMTPGQVVKVDMRLSIPQDHLVNPPAAAPGCAFATVTLTMDGDGGSGGGGGTGPGGGGDTPGGGGTGSGGAGADGSSATGGPSTAAAGSGSAGALAVTGSETVRILLASGALTVAGVFLGVVARRRREARSLPDASGEDGVPGGAR